MLDELQDRQQKVRAQIQARLDALEDAVRGQPTSSILETIRAARMASGCSNPNTGALAVLLKVYAERDGQAAADDLMKAQPNL